ncbi:MAG: SH3 domain protein [Gammaproteobacteria bacterium]|jgi:SH3 domain protein
MNLEAVPCLSRSESPKKMTKNTNLQIILFICSVTFLSASTAATKYVTDEFEVTMRSGTSTANNIIRMLKSGQRVTILEEDLASKYSLVETEDGKTGYVLNRYLLEGTSARSQLEKLKIQSDRQNELITTLNVQVKDLESVLDNEKSDNSSLNEKLSSTENELTHVTNAAENTLSIMDDNKRLNSIEQELLEDKRQLSDENARLKDSTKMDWFIRGAAVSLIAFLLGIGITRIRWKKQDSWGSY